MLYLLLTLGILVLAGVLWQLVRLSARLARLEQRVRRVENGKAIFLVLALSGPASGQVQPPAPADAVVLALRDVRQQPAQLRGQTRYLSLGHVSEAERGILIRVLGYHCNALSREADIVLPAVVPGTGGTLLRLNLSDYDWPADVWDKLQDPMFHVKIQAQPAVKKLWPGGVWAQDGKHYPAGSFWYTEKATAGAKKTALAPWLPAAEAAELVNLTQSAAPIVRGDWFLWQTAVNHDRGGAGYYAFLGVKSKADFDKMAGYDRKLARAAKLTELQEAVAVSTVTLQPRRIEVDRALSGHYYTTFDNAQAVDDHNPLRILNGGFKFDAQEFFHHLPNGVFAWGLANAKGELQDTAPDNIASDSTAHGTDRRVAINLSCIRCHGPQGGVQPVDGWARNLFVGELRLQSPDYDKLKELRQKYLRDLDGPLEDGRRTYTRAIAQATGGMKPAELAAAYGRAFAEYDAPVSLERAARDAGTSPENFQRGLRAYLLRTGSVDTVASAFLSKRRGGLPVTSYHEAIPLIQTALRGVVP